ncbi:hypothetical protein D9619_006936 [Psilocybe cf. subviscida]|uniref:Uncharacterized protein n=1 Tax=Psilocybe cf. subviscida TaxID=2480587 RepID=A0A8H5B357_9AGAR|nr:hypothetical protein D9619_006936 [Psilocybe cf. subviscida]
MPEAAAKNVTQPQAATQMSVMNVAEAANKTQQQVHEEHQHKHGKASRIRGGGAGKA